MQCNNPEKKMLMQSMIGSSFIEEHLSDLKNCDYLTVTSMGNMVFVKHPDGKTDIRQLLSMVDENFFRLYDYEFVAGEPFTRADRDSGVNVAIITDRLASKLFGSAEAALGRDITVESYTYRVRGVVREGSSINPDSYSNIFVPVSLKGSRSDDKGDLRRYMGGYKVAMKVSDPDKIQALKDEINEKVSRISATDPEGWSLIVRSMPSKVESAFGSDGTESETLFDILKPYIIVLMVLLVIPALNISGMIGGQMNRRLSEIGLRRSFGAPRGSLCSQVMFENFILTLVGGALGLILVWLVLILGHNRLLIMLASGEEIWSFMISPPEVTAEMLFAPAVFIGALVVCVVLNVLSAYIPVRLALRRPIVTSLNNKR